MDSLDRIGFTIALVSGVGLGGCTAATETASEAASGEPLGFGVQAVESEEEVLEDAPPLQDEPLEDDPGELANDPGYGPPPPGYYGGTPGAVIGVPAYGYGPLGGPGYVVGAPGYAEGCDAYGNCFRSSEFVGGGPGGYSYGRSTSWSSQSGAVCDTFGCVYY